MHKINKNNQFLDQLTNGLCEAFYFGMVLLTLFRDTTVAVLIGLFHLHHKQVKRRVSVRNRNILF